MSKRPAQDGQARTAESASDMVVPSEPPSVDDHASAVPSVPGTVVKQQRTHDPRQVIEDLRNHLAAHDRRLAFLFGAGTSSAINIAPSPNTEEQPTHKPLIPAVAALTDICKTAVSDKGDQYASAWDALAGQCQQKGHAINIENILSSVRSKRDAIGDGETLVGLDSDALKDLETTICSTIAQHVIPDEATIPDPIPHDNFVQWVQRVRRTASLEIFTTNYDILLERAFEHASLPVFDGFVGAHEPFFYADCLEDEDLLPRPKWVRLWKLHGSVNWKAAEVAGRKRIIRGRPDTSGEMILPSDRKYDESRKEPYTSFMDRLGRVLRAEHALLITCAYGFGDQDINAVLFGMLNSNPTGNVIVLWFDELNVADNLVEKARNRSNLTLVGPNAGVVSGVWGEWRLNRPVDNKTHAFLDTAFDSNAYPEDSASPAAATDDLRGKMRLGDFNWFCRFLSEMGASAP